jgi:ribose 5-phosphate isomerase B
MRRIAIASDHGGFELKEELKKLLTADGLELVDLGVASAASSVDYPDYADVLCGEILAGRAALGILVCGTGIGMSIAANRRRGIRAALCTDPFMARMAREHNDANVLCLGGRVLCAAAALEIVREFLAGAFAGGRHVRRLAKIDAP